MPDRNLRIPAGEHELVAILRLPKDIGTFPLVILCHGLRATKSDLIIVTLARELAYAGYATLRFDFFDHGESGGSFANTTLTKNILDLQVVLRYVQTLAMINPKHIVLIGHSLGGSVAVAAAKSLPIAGLVTINTRAVLSEYIHSYCTPDQVLEWQKTGETMLLGQYPLRKSFLDDLQHHDTLVDVAVVRCPILICQGTDDMRIPLASARQLFGAARGDKQLAIIEGADHGFRDEGKQKELLQMISEWLKRVIA